MLPFEIIKEKTAHPRQQAHQADPAAAPSVFTRIWMMSVGVLTCDPC
ncbi:hypothetical protein THIX_60141 [Thiomonas sp. X19]|nr:hypothetical protein THIX_60141 [Thiomonas sp. X19]